MYHVRIQFRPIAGVPIQPVELEDVASYGQETGGAFFVNRPLDRGGFVIHYYPADVVAAMHVTYHPPEPKP